MHRLLAKAFAFLFVTLSLLSIVNISFGLDYYPTSYLWDFQNQSYLGFSQAMNFTETPYQGIPHDSNLVGYWNMNEGIGDVARDTSGNGVDAVLFGCSWVNGKYGKAASFNGVSSRLSIPDSASLHLRDMTLSLWYDGSNPSNGSGTYRNLVAKGDYWDNSMWALYVSSTNYKSITFSTRLGGGSQKTVSFTHNNTGFVNIIVTKSSGFTCMYIDGRLVASDALDDDTSVVTQSIELSGATRIMGGIMDDLRIYNRALSSAEVAQLFTMGQQPDSASFSNYYTFSVATNIMLIRVSNPNSTGNNISVVTCTNFFAGNRLTFQANNSATVNVWTNLGQPAFTTGVWNSQNYTTTLTLNDSSTAELNWNTYNITTYADAHSSVSPSNITVAYGGSQTLNFSATQGYRFNVTVDDAPQGQISSYTFNNVTAPHTVNVTSTQLFTITASAGSGGSIIPSGSVVVGYGQTQQFNFTANTGYHISKVLVDNVSQSIALSYTFSNVTKNHTIAVSFGINTYNITALADSHSTITPGNVSINHGESQLFSITADSDYYISHVYVDGEDQGKISSYNFTNVQSTHTISVSSAALAPTPTPSPSPSPTSTSPPSQTNPFPAETIALAAAAITIVIAVFALALKKGYITIETVVEESPEETPEDYNI